MVVFVFSLAVVSQAKLSPAWSIMVSNDIEGGMVRQNQSYRSWQQRVSFEVLRYKCNVFLQRAATESRQQNSENSEDMNLESSFAKFTNQSLECHKILNQLLLD